MGTGVFGVSGRTQSCTIGSFSATLETFQRENELAFYRMSPVQVSKFQQLTVA